MRIQNCPMYSRFYDEICLKQPELHAQFQLYNDFYDTCTKFHNKKIMMTTAVTIKMIMMVMIMINDNADDTNNGNNNDSNLSKNDNDNDDKDAPWITIFWSWVGWFANDFHEWRSHEWKSLTNHLTPFYILNIPFRYKQSSIAHFAIGARDGLFWLDIVTSSQWICDVTRTRGTGIVT